MENGETFKIYLASPLGFSEEGRLYIKEVLLPKLGGIANLGFLDPWGGILPLSNEQLVDAALTLRRDTAIQLGRSNFAMIDKADMVLANLNGTDRRQRHVHRDRLRLQGWQADSGLQDRFQALGGQHRPEGEPAG